MMENQRTWNIVVFSILAAACGGFLAIFILDFSVNRSELCAGVPDIEPWSCGRAWIGATSGWFAGFAGVAALIFLRMQVKEAERARLTALLPHIHETLEFLIEEKETARIANGILHTADQVTARNKHFSSGSKLRGVPSWSDFKYWEHRAKFTAERRNQIYAALKKNNKKAKKYLHDEADDARDHFKTEISVLFINFQTNIDNLVVIDDDFIMMFSHDLQDETGEMNAPFIEICNSIKSAQAKYLKQIEATYSEFRALNAKASQYRGS